MKVYVAVVLDEDTHRPKRFEVFKTRELAEKYLTDNNTINTVVEKEVRTK